MPNRLCFVHDIRISHDFLDPPITGLAILFILIILVFSIVKARKWPLITYCTIFFFLHHLVEGSFIPLELIFEHRNYLPSMLFFVPIAILLIKGLEHFAPKKIIHTALIFFIPLVLIATGNATFLRNIIWKTDESLWMDVIDKYPALPRAHHNLANYYEHLGLIKPAILEYTKALDLPEGLNRRTHHHTHRDLGLLYYKQKNYKLSLKHISKSLLYKSDYTKALNMLGVLKIREGNYKEAFDCFIQSLTKDRNNFEAHNNLGFILLKQKRFDEAINEFHKALKINKSESRTYINLGIAYKYKEEFGKAINYLKEGITLNRNLIMPRLHILEIYYRIGQHQKALQIAQDLVNSKSIKLLSEIIIQKVLQEDPMVEAPDPRIISSIFSGIYKKKGDQYYIQAKIMRKKGY